MGTSIRYDRQAPLKSTGVTSVRKSEDDCGCNHCGDLESVCRPRFFAGQLLTEEDLRRLDKYIVSKNKLHNRYLHGWGVVAGLDVRCNGCDGNVTVSEGYALSPCGDDIIVPDDVRVDIPALIRGVLKPKKPRCGEVSNNGCSDESSEWLLSICYSETDSKGVTPLKAGSSDCGCAGEVARTTTKATSVCEATQVCEGYTFKVTPVKPALRKAEQKGALLAALESCICDLKEILTNPGSIKDQQGLANWCCDTKHALLDYVASHPSYDCDLARRLEMLACPTGNMNPQEFNALFQQSVARLRATVLELMFACVCRALQPPVIKSTEGDCVPLAVLTVDPQNGYKVKSICNWTTSRKYAITMPALEYWFSVIPIGKMIRESLETFCCSGGGLRDVIRTPDAPDVAAPVATPGAAAASVDESTMAYKASAYRAKLSDISPLSYMRPSAATAEQMSQFAGIARTFMGQKIPSVNADFLADAMFTQNFEGMQFMKEMFSNISGSPEMAREKTAESETISAQVDELRVLLKKQQLEIEKLTRVSAVKETPKPVTKKATDKKREK